MIRKVLLLLGLIAGALLMSGATYGQTPTAREAEVATAFEAAGYFMADMSLEELAWRRHQFQCLNKKKKDHCIAPPHPVHPDVVVRVLGLMPKAWEEHQKGGSAFQAWVLLTQRKAKQDYRRVHKQDPDPLPED